MYTQIEEDAFPTVKKYTEVAKGLHTESKRRRHNKKSSLFSTEQIEKLKLELEKKTKTD